MDMTVQHMVMHAGTGEITVKRGITKNPLTITIYSPQDFDGTTPLDGTRDDFDGKIVLFIQPAQKFKARYATVGFEDRAKLDDGDMWPISYALVRWTPEVEARVVELVEAAVG